MSEKHIDFLKFIDSSNYYKTSMHVRRCKICQLPPAIKTKLNKMILDGVDYGILEHYLLEQFPTIFNSKFLPKTIESHKKYLPYLISDVQIKSIFKRARSIIENKNIDMMDNNEKAQLITEIENEIISEYSDIENERISLLNVLFKEILPMMVSRLQDEIISGKAKDIKDVTDASTAVWKLTTAMAAAGATIKEEEKEEVDFSKLDLENSKDTKSKVVSLRDSINKATKGMI